MKQSIAAKYPSSHQPVAKEEAWIEYIKGEFFSHS